MKNWQKHFWPQIWLRGLEYYKDGAVQFERRDGDCYMAVVSGSEEYDVEIELHGEQIRYMDCSCPHAAEGNHCKHMAAVLIALDAGDFDGQQAAALTPEELVSRIPEAELRSLLAGVLEGNDLLYRRLLLQYEEPKEKKQPAIAQLRAELALIPEAYENRYGEIDYRDAYDFACNIAEFIESQALSLAKAESVLAAAAMGWEAVGLYCQQEVDDSDGGTSHVGDAIHALYEGILEFCDKKEGTALFRETVKRYREQGVHWIMEEMLRELLLSGIWGKDIKKEQLQFLDDEIAGLEAAPEKSEWKLRGAILSRLNIMDENDLAALCGYMDAHLDIAEIRKRRAELYLQNHDNTNAIRLFLEGKEQAKEAKHYGTECEFSRLLIDAYEDAGKRHEMLQEMEQYVFRYQQDDLAMLLRIKETVDPKQWEELRSRYLSGKDTTQKGELMRHEQMWDALLAYVIQSNSVWVVDRFEADLKGHYPQEMLALYRSYLVHAAERATDRKGYKSLMPYLKKIKSYPGGTEVARELAADWRTRYRRRSAMLDELKKAGF